VKLSYTENSILGPTSGQDGSIIREGTDCPDVLKIMMGLPERFRP